MVGAFAYPVAKLSRLRGERQQKRSVIDQNIELAEDVAMFVSPSSINLFLY